MIQNYSRNTILDKKLEIMKTGYIYIALIILSSCSSSTNEDKNSGKRESNITDVGADLFRTNCISCHNLSADSINIKGKKFTDQFILNLIKTDSTHKAFATNLSDSQIVEINKYIQTTLVE